jgi:hypothetical protein
MENIGSSNCVVCRYCSMPLDVAEAIIQQNSLHAHFFWLEEAATVFFSSLIRIWCICAAGSIKTNSSCDALLNTESAVSSL